MGSGVIFRDVDLGDYDKPPARDPNYDDNGVSPRAQVAAEQDETQPIPGGGGLLEEPDPKRVFKAIHTEVEAQKRLAANREAARKHRSRVRRGVPFSTLRKVEDRGEWIAELPPGINDEAQPIPNKVDDLCTRIVAQVVVDPFLPDPKPENDSERARGATDLSKRFLRRDGDESGTNDAQVVRECADIGQTNGSGFAHLWMDMKGGGWRPLRIKAHPLALDANNPLVDPNGQPTTDYQLRYVTPDGQFTKNPSEADRQWMPKFRRDLLGAAHIRTVPESASVADAESVILLMCYPLCDAKRRLPALEAMGDDEIRTLIGWRPPKHKTLVPESLTGRLKAQDAVKGNANAGVTEDALIFWYQKYCIQGSTYQDGAEIAVSGANGGTVLRRALLRDDVEQDEGATKPILRSIPVAQFKCLTDTEGRDPFGRCPIDRFGAANEGLAQLYGGIMEDTDRRLHPDIFLTSQTTVQPGDLGQRDGRHHTVYTKEDQPTYEVFAELATFTPVIIGMIAQGMETAAGLSEGLAQGLEGPQSGTSGVAKEAVIRQAKVALAEIYQNTLAGIKRLWRLKLELAQCKLTVPQQVEFSGEDGAYRQRWWTGADLVGVGDVALQAGSGTMMSPAEKQQFLAVAQQQQWLDPWMQYF